MSKGKEDWSSLLVEDQRQNLFQRFLSILRPNDYQEVVDKDIKKRRIHAALDEYVNGTPPLRRLSEPGVIYDSIQNYSLGLPNRSSAGQELDPEMQAAYKKAFDRGERIRKK